MFKYSASFLDVPSTKEEVTSKGISFDFLAVLNGLPFVAIHIIVKKDLIGLPQITVILLAAFRRDAFAN